MATRMMQLVPPRPCPAAPDLTLEIYQTLTAAGFMAAQFHLRPDAAGALQVAYVIPGFKLLPTVPLTVSRVPADGESWAAHQATVGAWKRALEDAGYDLRTLDLVDAGRPWSFLAVYGRDAL